MLDGGCQCVAVPLHGMLSQFAVPRSSLQAVLSQPRAARGSRAGLPAAGIRGKERHGVTHH